MRISAAIMAHPKRKKQAEALSKMLKQYPFVDVSISFDQPGANSHQEEWDNGKRALQAGVGLGEWHVVVQDDAILCPDFHSNLEGAIRAAPSKSLISLYTGTSRPIGKRVKTAVDNAYHASWLQFWMLLWGVGIAIPSDHIEPVLEFVNDPQYKDSQYDTRIGYFYNRNRLPVYYTMPSLVDHDDDLPSLLGGHGREINGDRRVAHRLADGPVRWNNKVINI